MTTAFPPQVLGSSHRISPSTALANISAYLVSASEDASFHPNAILTEKGPDAPTAGSSVGIVLHNLKRIEAGLQGKSLRSDVLFNDEDGNAATSGLDRAEQEIESETKAQKLTGTGNGNTKIDEASMEWQNLSEFEREQETEECGNMDEGNPALAEDHQRTPRPPKVSKTKRKAVEMGDDRERNGHGPDQRGGSGDGIEVVGDTEPIDKEQRKRAKKERLKQAKRDKELERQKG